MEKTWIVYVHKCKTTNKYYVGITCQKPKRRWGNGKSYTQKNNLKFYNAIQKYGWDNFEHFIIDFSHDLEKAYELEEYYIEQLDSYKNGYNSTTGGKGSKGKILSMEARKRISEENKGKTSWVKYAPKEKLPMYGKHHTEETKRKIGNANRGRVLSQEARQKMRMAKLGKTGAKRTEETKLKLRLSKIGSKNPMYGNHTNYRKDVSVPVIQYDIQGKIVNEYESIRNAEKITGIQQISRAIKRNIKAGGFIWKKKN